MLIQFQPQHLSILEFELGLLAIELEQYSMQSTLGDEVR
jgi:hypothetical protein